MRIVILMVVALLPPLFFTSCIGGNAGTAAVYEPKPGTNEIDIDRVRSFLPEFRSKPEDQLNAAENDKDFDRRAAAGYIRLDRAHVPVSAEGVRTVESEYLSEPSRRAYGFVLLGNLATLGIGTGSIKEITMDFVESNPQSPDCDFALWALGETGDDDAFNQFIRIAGDTAHYGTKARERSFCCLSDCGRYSMTKRFDEIPRVLELARQAKDAQSQNWVMLALHDMAPGAAFGTVDDCQAWWDRQSKLRAASQK
jgi:hypothetical protein